MTTRYVYILVTLAGLLAASAGVAAADIAREHDSAASLQASKMLPDLAELIEWHSGSPSARINVSPRWKSSLKRLDAEDSAPLLRMHGAPGFQDLAQDQFRRASGYSRIPIDFRDFAQRPIRHDR